MSIDISGCSEMATKSKTTQGAKKKGGSSRRRPRRDQLHPTFPAYQRWVIEKLVGILAADNTNVLPHIVMRWIDQNQDYLKGFNITYPEYLDSLRRPLGVVLAMKEEKVAPNTDRSEENFRPSGSNVETV
jgi:hypothetical protein